MEPPAEMARHRDMKLNRIPAIVLAGAVALAVTACEPKDEAGAGSEGKDKSASSGTGDGGGDDSGDGDGKDDTRDELGVLAGLTVTKTGGISGIEETLEVDSEGKWSYVKARMAPKKGELSDSELGDLKALATDGGIKDKGKKSDTRCNDMQVYSVDIDVVKGDDLQVSADECGVGPNEQFDELINLLSEATPI